MKHLIYEPAASDILGLDGAPITSYETGLTSEKMFDGQPFARITVMATNTNGEVATISVRGTVEGLTTERVQAAVRTLNFIRVKFSGLTLEERGDSFNKLTRIGVAEKAELVPAAPASGAKS